MSQLVEMIVFDMAGTTIKDNHEVEDCFIKAVNETGLTTTHDEINAMMGWSKRNVFEKLWRKELPKASAKDLAKRIDYSYDAFREILEAHYLHTAIIPTEGALEVFEFLKERNIKIALTTGFYRKVTDIILQKLNWNVGLDRNYAGNVLINASISSDQVIASRPAPFMIFRAMELCNVADVRKIIKIGDTPSDLAEGKNAGCLYSFGITNGTHSKSELEIYENDGLLENLFEFKTRLESIL
ncbi:Haloacid dehalogenase domain protein hydrolase [Paludibacter propionicigenes WB4]|uniref:Haloacid dehalogenase domain protein hydrolase n=1 Tax=Paludibacter propionicigenes (strain DSM 17365 / JCM 13257 / WB4) TaxID=694427 RepID=E4T106_PALPW|nr:HAD hydrolase-like protein [Paludibacter propionicigenes]ADQ78387.1 Haloacid dehalogenase domain protein hydrolase [Paludibacter propionicigenes WB4]